MQSKTKQKEKKKPSDKSDKICKNSIVSWKNLENLDRFVKKS